MRSARLFPAARTRSTRRLNHESQRGRSLRHALLISNQEFQVGGNPLRRCKVYRGKRSEDSRVERRRGIQQRIVQTDEMNPVKDQSRSAQGCRSEVTNGAGHLGSRQRARDSIAMAPQEAAKRPRFRLAHDQFYDCGRVEIDHRAVLPAQRSCLRMRARRRDAGSCPWGQAAARRDPPDPCGRAASCRRSQASRSCPLRPAGQVERRAVRARLLRPQLHG